MKTKRWMCIQQKSGYAKQDWFAEWTLSYTRKSSIELLTKEGTTSWADLKKHYGWRCSKVEVIYNEIS